MSFISRTLSKETSAPTVVGFDLRLPTSQPNPDWYGTVELYIDAPSVNIHNQSLGLFLLKAWTPNVWKRAEFGIPTSIQTALNNNYTDLRWRIQLNVPSNATGQYLVDRFTLSSLGGGCTPMSDGNPCTLDQCDANGQQQHIPVPAGTSCSDSNVCNGAEVCNATATCLAGTPLTTDDNNPCTTDACDPANGVSHTPVPTGTSCTDGNACNGAETCNASAVCTAGTPPTIDDNNPCTTDACNPSTGVTHTPVAAGTSCSDGNACNGAEACNGSGVCLGGTPPAVDDGNPCTTDSCNPTSGVTHTPVPAGTSCSDGNTCNGAEACNGSAVCLAGTPPVIDDANACTLDACDAVLGVSHTPLPSGTSCSDGNACNGAEACNATAVCVAGAPPAVDDGNPCTTDACNPATGVTHTPVAAGTSCSDGNACNGAEACDSTGSCLAGTVVTCVATDICHDVGTCNPSTGACSNPIKPDGTACSDNNVCNGAETCHTGSCTAGSPLPTDDNNPCTADACDPTGGVTHTAVANGTACSDGDQCNGAETCQSGACAAGTPVNVDDGNPCTVDTCSPVSGDVTHTAAPNGTSCADTNVCNGSETCLAGACAPGTALDVNDNNPCTADTCDPATGAQHTPRPAGSSCSDFDLCNGNETCNANAACQPGTPVSIDTTNPCSVGTCDPATGVVTYAPAPIGTNCSLDLCTEGACNATGECTASGSTAQDDGDPCTIEWCDPATGPKQTRCTDLDRTVGTTLASSMQWLYASSNPVQIGVAAGTIQAQRAAAIRGLVTTRDSSPLPGVKVTIEGHPEFGYTLTHTDGYFDLVVNGGGTFLLRFERRGYLHAQRSVLAMWGDYARVADLALVPLDPVVTAVDLQGAGDFQVAQGSTQTDADGTRKGTLLFPAGTEATMHLPDGSTQSLDALNVRITEFTVGPNGEKAMPGELPAESRYTYAFEVGADEAVAANSPSVTFSVPLIYYVDNFLHFPSGTTVPLGSLDRPAGQWKADQSGVVMDIVGVSAGLALIDVTGDGTAESSSALATYGITDTERRKLAELYVPGQSLWRVRLSHFTNPWDCNWGGGPPPDASGPTGDGPSSGPDQPPNCPGGGMGSTGGSVPMASTIQCETQVLSESIPIAGTPYSLNYTSDRVVGNKQQSSLIKVPLSNTVPGSALRIDLDVDVAGQHIHQTFPPNPNQSTTVAWDGTDAFHRPVQGSQSAIVSVAYVYPYVYTKTSQFGYNGNGLAINGDLGRGEISVARKTRLNLGVFEAKALGLGGWTLDVHHVHELGNQRLELGTGERRDAHSLTSVAQVLVDVTGDVGATSQMAVGADRSVYFAGNSDTRVRRRAPDGTISVFAGSSTAGHAGDGLPANDPAVRLRVNDIALGVDGSMYLAETDNNAVRKIDATGIIHTIAGTTTLGHSGDGGDARFANLRSPNSLAVAPDGSIFIGERASIRRVAPNGTISTVAGTDELPGSPPMPSDGSAGTSVRIEPKAIAFDQKGKLYAAIVAECCDTMATRIVRFEDGRVYQVAGNGASFGDDGLPPKSSAMRISSLAFDADGRLYFTDASSTGATFNPRLAVRTIDLVTNRVSTVAGGMAKSTPNITTNGSPITAVKVNIIDVALGPDGLYCAGVDATNHSQVFRVSAPLPDNSGGPFTIADRDGDALFSFDASGRHLTTRHSLTGGPLYTFGYDARGLLATVKDRANLTTTIERDSAGAPQAIVGPFGQRTALGLDAHGYLATVTDPEGNTTGLEYTSDGLLTQYTNARSLTSSFAYDASGLLQTDSDPAGGSQALSRTTSGRDFTVTRTTALSRTTIYSTQFTAVGDQHKVNTDPASLVTDLTIHPDRSVETVTPDGTRVTSFETADTRYGLGAPIASRTTRLPSGLTSTTTTSRAYTALNPSNPFDFQQLIDTTTINSQTWQNRYDAPSRTFTRISPANRAFTQVIDLLGRTTQTTLDGLASQNFFYDPSGRLDHVTQGVGALARTTSYGYVTAGASSGYLDHTTDALTNPTTYVRDALGRTQSETRAGATTTFAWDPLSNLASVTPPGKPVHGMSYSPVNLLQTYDPPPNGLPASSTSYTYDADRMLRTESRPDGVQIARTPDAAGRLDTVAIPGGLIDYTYYPAGATSGGGNLSDIQGPYGVALHLTYDGKLNTSATWSGDITGSVAWNYNSDFNKIRESVTGTTSTAQAVFGYDADQLLTCASPTTCNPAGADALKLTRNGAGLVSAINLTNTSETLTYNPFGELASQTATYAPSTPLVSITYDAPGVERDKLGRIVHKTEVIAGTTKVYDYTYDARRRLTDVTINGTLEEHFDYDPNGNRTLGYNRTAGTNYTGTYDDQDRLLSYGPFDYTYTANGELETKTNRDTGEAWLFQYDALGNLLTVGLPNGDLVEYLVDGMGRRVGKKKNGVLLKQWLYRNAIKPVAELDGTGALVSEFVYGSKSNVPDYVRRGGATYRVITDHLGSPRYVVNIANSADVPFTATYTSFGVVTGTGLDWMPFGFAGGIYDSDSQLVRFGARDYDPSIGRWIRRDPALFAGRQSDLYLYIGNDPINGIDPSGRVGGAEVGACYLCQASRNFITGACAAGAGPIAGGIAAVGTLAICSTVCSSTLKAIGDYLLPPPIPEPPHDDFGNDEDDPGACYPQDEPNKCGG